MTILRWLTRIGYLLATLVLLFLLASGPVYKLGWVGLGIIFQILKLAVPAGLLAIVLLLIGRLSKAAGNRAVLVIVVLAALLYLPVNQALIARSVPHIHDISTDVTDPPRFSVAMVAARKDARNPPEYAGAETAELQHQAYPDIQTLRVATPAAGVFDLARELVDQRGWDIVQADPANGIIEASATSWWFGFVDDIIIRIVPNGEQTMIDMRSKSRIGSSDIGANARRIRDFLQQLQQQL